MHTSLPFLRTPIRIALASALCGIALASLGGCVVKKGFGQKCGGDNECCPDKITDCSPYLCKSGKCNFNCRAQSDCPVGTDCGIAATGDATPTCYARTYAQPAGGGFGTNCAAVSVSPSATTPVPCVAGSPNPCAAGFSCHATRKCDPNAYCTSPCTGDTTCPPTMFCATRASDNTRYCAPRTDCTPCATDDQCELGWLCASDGKGGHSCAKPCNASSDCPPAPNDDTGNPAGRQYELCAPDLTARAKPVSVCTPVAGCFGPSTVQGVSGVGQPCSPCRTGMPEDCGTGLICFFDSFSTERFCTKECTLELVMANGSYNIGNGTDTCQAISSHLFCVIGPSAPSGCGSRCTAKGLCASDPMRTTATCHPL